MGRVTPGSLRHLRTNPEACAHWLATGADLWATSVTVVLHHDEVTILEATFQPPPQADDYPEERVRIVVRRDGAIFAIPIPTARSWKHRYPAVTIHDLLTTSTRYDWYHLLGALCLEYPRDPDHLRWSWGQGLHGYLRLVQRHIWSEEFHRRHGIWPAEDTPHRDRPDGQPHPILTEELRQPA